MIILDQEKYGEQLKQHKVLFVFTAIATVTYIVWRAVFTIPRNYGIVALIVGLLFLLAEAMSAYQALVNYSMLSDYKPPEMPDLPDELFPEVDIFIATHNEDVDLLFNTVNACTYLDYPDKSKIHIHLCDDNNRPE